MNLFYELTDICPSPSCPPGEHIWRFVNSIRAYQCIRCLTIRHPVEPFYVPYEPLDKPIPDRPASESPVPTPPPSD